jgi:hypothetical protein
VIVALAVGAAIGVYLYLSMFSGLGAERAGNVIDVVRGYLKVYPTNVEIRNKVVEIFREYISSAGAILHESVYVGAGSSRTIVLKLYEDLIYWISVDVSGSFCINCDIHLELKDSRGNIVAIMTPQGPSMIFGRYKFLKTNFTLSPLFRDYTDMYILTIDNSYSILTSKTVYITIKAYYPSYVTADDYFKIFAVGHWISKRFMYVSDPYGLEYVTPPNQTLKTLAGDCDDLAMFLAVLYRSVGLDAGVALIDTDGDGRADHATAIIYLDKDPNEVLRGIAKWASAQGIIVNGISYVKAEKGIYLVVDPLMTKNKDNPWRVDASIYKLVQVIKP